jgi:hypothetical protein
MAQVLEYPLAGTPLSDEVSRTLLEQYGVHPERITAIGCEDIGSLIETVAQTDAIYLGIVSAAREGLAGGQLIELPVRPTLAIGARFAYVSLVGRTEAPVMQLFRQLVAERLGEASSA